MRFTFLNKIVLISSFLWSIMVLAQEDFRTIGNLPDEISETSGLIFFNESLITHNDSGNEPFLYELDTVNLTIKRTIVIANVANIDWEALAQDENYIYIGDFGNNVGTRQDLAVHRILKADYLSSDTVTATTINFSYQDQTDFINTGNSDWDAEAFFVLNDDLIIITKQWESQGAVAYSLPKQPGTYVAEQVASISNIGLVTDAAYNSKTNSLVILGYSSILVPFIGVVNELNANSIFEGVSITNLGLNFVQAEGITYANDDTYYISSERFSRTSPTINSPSLLYAFKLTDESEPEQPEEPQNPEEPENPEEPQEPENPTTPEVEDELIIYQDVQHGTYKYEIRTDRVIKRQMVFDITGRKIWETTTQIKKEGVLNFPLEDGIYYFLNITDNGLLYKAFVPRQ